MATLKIIGLSLLGIFTFFVLIGLVFGEPKKPGTVKDYVDNPNNKRGYHKGSIAQAVNLFNSYTKMDKPQIEATMDSTDLSLHEISYALYFWAMRHIQEGKIKEGYELLKVAADDYLNPIAMVKLARINFHGSQALQQGKTPIDLELDKDLETSYYYITLAFEITRVLNEKTGDKVMLNHVVNSGLALYDTFGMNQLEEGFNRKEVSMKLNETWTEKIDQFTDLYL
ncbi:MAG: hypothetical protein KTR30_23795 [Saprospiraceae bacterium]|nr:hypothetical protein [Saprospiraceae bacterium]